VITRFEAHDSECEKGFARALGSKETRRVAMAEMTQFTIGVDATCTDGVCGQVSRVVVDPIHRVTHLVVEPKHRQGLGRLVPVDLVDATPDEVRLRCTQAEFEELEAAEKTEFSPGTGGYGVPQALVQDTVPMGDVAVHPGEPVHATDGDIGRVRGFLVDSRNHEVTHVLLREGHMWGAKEVAIPIRAVTRFGPVIQLNIPKEEVKDLPPVGPDLPKR
jgi:hypothetical protein